MNNIVGYCTIKNNATTGESRALDKSSEFERIKIIEKIDEYNQKIAQWKTKGQHWYNNKWYYSDECQNIDYLK